MAAHDRRPRLARGRWFLVSLTGTTMATAYRESPEPEAANDAVNAILGANPFVGFDALRLAQALGRFLKRLAIRPDVTGPRLAQLSLELMRIAGGESTLKPEPSDRRFADPAWSDSPIYKPLMQTYLAWRGAILKLCDADGLDWRDAEQQRFAVTLLTESLSPTNLLAGNPAALKRAFETGGQSLLRGLANFVDDFFRNGAMPSQVDKRPFDVGRNIAVTAGAVIYRGELCEVIQYAPKTELVFQRPVLLIPPQINKFYIMDLAPGRSFVEHAVSQGLQFFAISWRNPTPADRAWDLDRYVAACQQAIDAVCEITGSEDCNLVGLCAGGITGALLLGHLAAASDPKVHCATLLVTMLESGSPSMTTMFLTEEMVADAVRRSEAKGVLEGGEMARTFAWMRPNDLVWNYWVNNYLMGNRPPAFDILFWNCDSTSLPAALHADFLTLLLKNLLTRAGAATVLGTPIDLRRVKCDIYLLAGLTDHICPWRSCYSGTAMFGGRVEFVLSSSGHVQSLVNPPGNPKARYFVNSSLPADPEQWFGGAKEHPGSWWEHWASWISQRSGDRAPARTVPGSKRHPALESAPGRYVREHR